MKSKILSMFMLTAILLSISLMTAAIEADYTETFENSLATSTYEDGSFVGDNDISWNYVAARDEGDYAISGNGLMLRSLSEESKVYSETLGDGIGSFSVQLKKGFTGSGERQVELFINGVSKATSEAFDDDLVHTFEVENIDVEGDVVIRLDNIQEGQVVVDDISWTVYDSAEEPNKFCELDTADDTTLSFKKIKIKNKGPSEDGDDNEWYPLDKIEIEVELENNGDDELEDIVFEFGLFEKGSDTNLADEMIWLSEDDEEIELGDIEEKGEDDELEHTFEFKINPEEVEKGNYIVMIKAYPDGDEDLVCVDHTDDLTGEFGDSEYYAEVDIRKEDKDEGRAVVVDVESLSLIQATCDEEISVTVDVWNLGDLDQEQVKVMLINEELGLELEEVIRDDLDEGEKEEVTFVFKMPKDADAKTYELEFTTYYEYDDDDDEYDEKSDEFHAFLQIEDECGSEIPTVRITADLDPETPEAVAGKQVIIKTTIENTGDKEQTYIISVSGNSAWSSLTAVDPQTITLAAGASEEVSIYLDLDEAAAGNKEFTIKANYEDKSVDQLVRLFVEEDVAGDSVSQHFRDNWFIYVIAIVNIILIIAIIAVIRSMSRAPIA